MSSLNFVPTAFQKENKIPNLVLSDLNNLFMALDDACARHEITEEQMTFACEALRRLGQKEEIL